MTGRAALYVDLSDSAAVEAALEARPDVLILDLEDAVPLERKPAARTALAELEASGRLDGRFVVVRVNALGSIDGNLDMAEPAVASAARVLIPKVEQREDILRARALWTDAGRDPPLFWAMVETTPVLSGLDPLFGEIEAMVVGTLDLLKALGRPASTPRAAIAKSLRACAAAARRAAIPAYDGIYIADRDPERFRADCVPSAAGGFSGRTAIWIEQIPIIRQVYR